MKELVELSRKYDIEFEIEESHSYYEKYVTRINEYQDSILDDNCDVIRPSSEFILPTCFNGDDIFTILKNREGDKNG